MSDPRTEYQQRVARAYRWNFCACTIDGGVFSFAMSLLSPVVVLPYYVKLLSGSEVLSGAIYTLYALGRSLPQIMAANMVKHRSRRKPFMIWMALLERGGIAVILLSTLLIQPSETSWSLMAFFGGYALLTLSLGLMSPAWLDFLAKAIYKRRGTFFGVLNATGGILSILGGIAFSALTRLYPFPFHFTAAFGLAFAVSLISLAALMAYREVPSPFLASSTSMGEHLRSLPALLRNDRNFRYFILSRAVIGVADAGVPFYAIYATRRIAGAASEVAAFNLALMISQAVSTLVWGYLGDRYGYRLIYRVAAVMGFATASLTLLVSDLSGYLLIFTLLGGTLGGLIIADSNLVLELSPREQTPTYVGMMNAVLGPVTGLAPLLGGVLATTWGYPAIFITAMIAQAAGWVGMSTLVREPREVPGPRATQTREGAPAVSEERERS
ncbi:MAG: MFS transporter [Anaerolineae bacterium]